MTNCSHKDIRQTAINLLTRREHSQYELQCKLKSRGFELHDIHQIIDELNQKGWQSDERFTENYIRSRIRNGFGPLKITQELQKRHVSNNLIEQYLNEYDKNQWIALKEKARIKRFGSEKPKEFKELMKQLRFLNYRGFSVRDEI